MQIWVLQGCEIEHERYEAGQKLDVSDVLGAYLLRASPGSFSTTDPNAPSVIIADEAEQLQEEGEEVDEEVGHKDLDAPPRDRAIRRSSRQK